MADIGHKIDTSVRQHSEWGGTIWGLEAPETLYKRRETHRGCDLAILLCNRRHSSRVTRTPKRIAARILGADLEPLGKRLALDAARERLVELESVS